MSEQERENIAYESDLDGFVKGPPSATENHLAAFSSEAGTIKDSGLDISSIPTTGQVETAVSNAVDASTSEIWNAVKGVDAIQAYGSDEWIPSHSYTEGDFCRYNGTDYYGYKCKSDHTSGQTFNESYWEGVLTKNGCLAIEEILSKYDYSSEGFAKLSELAPPRSTSSEVHYDLGQLVSEDGKLKICTYAAAGEGAQFTDAGATVDASITTRISTLDTALRNLITQHTSNTTIHVTSENKATWNAKQDAIDDLSEIRTDAAAGAAAALRDKIVISNGTVTAEHANGDGDVELASKSYVDSLSEDISAGAAAALRDKVVISDGTVTAEHADGTGGIELASKEYADSKADAVAIDKEYDTSDGGYSIDDTCTYNGKWYKCTSAVSEGDDFDDSSWEEITVKEAISDGLTQVQSDWDESDTDDPAYIKNKPTIPDAVVIDDTLSHSGEAADAKKVGDEIADIKSAMVSESKLPYELRDLVEVDESDSSWGGDTRKTYVLYDRTVNIIRTNIYDGKTIELIPPAAPVHPTPRALGLARDFYVVFLVDSDEDVEVGFSVPIYLVDYNEESVSLYVPAGEHVTYRFTDAAEGNGTFLVTLFADPANRKMRQIEAALDDILANEGDVVQTPNGIMIYEVTEHKYHRMVAVKDPETGEVNISIENQGVSR